MDRIDRIVLILYTAICVLLVFIIVLFKVTKCKTLILLSYFPLRNSNYKLATLLIVVLIAYAVYTAFYHLCETLK